MFVILLSIGKEYSENGKPFEHLGSENCSLTRLNIKILSTEN